MVVRGQIQGISRRSILVGGFSLAALGALQTALPGLAHATKLDDQIAAKQAEQSQTATQIADLRLEIETIVDNLHTAEEQRDAAEDEQKTAEASIMQTESDIAKNTQRISDLQDRLSGQMRLRYRSDDMGMYDVLLDSASFADFLTRWNMIDRINESDAALVGQVKKLRMENERKKLEFEAQSTKASEKAAEARKHQEEYQRLHNEASAKVAELELLQSNLTAELEQLVQEKEEIALAIARAQAAAGNEVQIIGNPYDLEPCPEVVPYAKSKLGCRYVFCAKGPDEFDCSGLTQWIYKQIGIKIPSAPKTQYERALRDGAVLPVSLSEPGDVLMRPGHVGLVTEPGATEFIHAPGTGDFVRYGTVKEGRRFLCALRFPRP